MKSIIYILCMFSFISLQAQLLEKLGNKVVNVAERSVEKRIEKESQKKTDQALDKVFENKGQKKNNKKNKEENPTPTNSSNPSLPVTQASDFVVGTQMIFADNFEKDAIGDFPTQWNTNGSGQIVQIQGHKWLSLNHNSIAHPELIKPLPENFTIQFDLLLLTENSQSTPYIQFGFTEVKNILKEKIDPKRLYLHLRKYDYKNLQAVEYGLNNQVIGNKNDFNLIAYQNKILHVDIAVNASRLRIYLDGQKVVDLPKAMTAALRQNFYVNNMMVIPASKTPVLIGNLKIASAEKDSRSQISKDLIEKGNVSTSDILFDSGRSTLHSSSFHLLDELASTIKEAKISVLIIGHTDSDGAEDANLKLSEERAKSVKNYLVTQHQIPSNLIMTTGQGESEPIANNQSEDGKKQNRRVEFKKL